MEVDEEITILCAVRYAMGRMSYAPGAVRDYIVSRISNMSDITKRKIKENIQRDLEEYQKEREPGMMNASQDEIVQWTELIKKLS